MNVKEFISKYTARQVVAFTSDKLRQCWESFVSRYPVLAGIVMGVIIGVLLSFAAAPIFYFKYHLDAWVGQLL